MNTDQLLTLSKLRTENPTACRAALAGKGPILVYCQRSLWWLSARLDFQKDKQLQVVLYEGALPKQK